MSLRDVLGADAMKWRAALVPACLLLVSGCSSEPPPPCASLSLRAPAHPRDVGYGEAFSVDAIPGCPDDSPEPVSWRQVSGPALRDVRVAADGLRFDARMPEARDVALEAPLSGIIPVSWRTSAEVVLEAEWRPRRGSVVRERVRLAAAGRARGLPVVPVDTGVLLAGAGWSITAKPTGAAASIGRSGGFARLIPDVAGRWVLADETGAMLSLRAGRYDETPLDCGRSRCHESIAAALLRSPMTFALRDRVEGAREPGEVACSIACHATGEVDVDDGGFDSIARALHPAAPYGDWRALPRALRRSGGVTCLACHGPAAIPEPSSRWAILRADVCATCHDAPPSYGHVAAWRSSRMARADADPRTRSNAACARCHTTAGFVASVTGASVRTAPVAARPIGVACAACHAVHDGNETSHEALVREVSVPAAFSEVPPESRVCVPCHAPEGGSPTASAAAIWAGRGGLDPWSGAPLEGVPLHAGVQNGCTGCHRAGPKTLERGTAHAFQVDPSVCAECHGPVVPDAAAAARDLRADALSILSRLTGRSDVPLHAAGLTWSADPVGRATFDVLLVLEDPAAGAHDARYARSLLAVARSIAERPLPPKARRP